MQRVPPDDYFHGNFSGERKETGSGVGALLRKEAYRRVRRESEEEGGERPRGQSERRRCR